MEEHIDKKKGNFCGIMNMDISTEFPKLDRQFLVDALVEEGVEEVMVNILRSYFQDRQYSINYKCTRSCAITTTNSVVQGSFTGPVLFAFVMKYVKTTVPGVVKTCFANDATLIFRSHIRDLHLQVAILLLFRPTGCRGNL